MKKTHWSDALGLATGSAALGSYATAAAIWGAAPPLMVYGAIFLALSTSYFALATVRGRQE